MRLRNTRSSWGLIARLLHWSMAGLIFFMLGLGVYMTRFTPDLLEQFDLTQTHKSWGFVVFTLALLRLAWRFFDRVTPAEPPETTRRSRIASSMTHGLFYLLVLVMPLSGWVMSAASPAQDLFGIDNMAFGAFAMPDPWVPGVEPIADAASLLHRACAILFAALITLHVGAALNHHFLRRDGILARMISGA